MGQTLQYLNTSLAHSLLPRQVGSVPRQQKRTSGLSDLALPRSPQEAIHEKMELTLVIVYIDHNGYNVKNYIYQRKKVFSNWADLFLSLMR
jgi:hypothetical protein